MYKRQVIVYLKSCSNLPLFPDYPPDPLLILPVQFPRPGNASEPLSTVTGQLPPNIRIRETEAAAILTLETGSIRCPQVAVVVVLLLLLPPRPLDRRAESTPGLERGWATKGRQLPPPQSRILE